MINQGRSGTLSTQRSADGDSPPPEHGIRSDLHSSGHEQPGQEDAAEVIHARFTYRMHNLSEFMKTLLQRFTRWFNRTHNRSGTLWEERYKSVIVESGGRRTEGQWKEGSRRSC